MKKHDLGRRLGEIAVLFLKLGTFGFGGLPVQIAMMEDEAVQRRQWLTRAEFMDLVGTTNLIPGPNSVEVAVHIGYLRARWLGFLVAGCCFVTPSAIISMAFAWFYIRFGALPYVGWLLYGIKPAVLAVIAAAVWRLGSTAVKSWQLAVIGSAVLIAVLLNVNQVIAILGGGVLGMLWLSFSQRQKASQQTIPLLLGSISSEQIGQMIRSASIGMAAALAVTVPVSLLNIGWFFLKVGAVLFGSGYVLVAFLSELVDGYGWLTQQQLLDAVAIGQFTPGPFLSTAAFIGYFLAGVPGGIVATVAIFLPSFVYVAALNPILPRLRTSPWIATFLDAINVSSISLLLVVTLRLIETTLFDWQTWTIALVATGVGLYWKINPSWLVLGGAIAGILLSAPFA